MKKLTILTSVLALAACGGGSGGGSGAIVNPNSSDMALGNIEIPSSRVSSTAANSNSAVTSMESSVTNISEMTAAVESAIGTDALNSIASDSDNISSVINRSASARHAALRAPGHHTDKEKGAYLFLEGGKRFKNWGHDKRRDFYREQPDMVKYWGKIFCGCNIDSYNEDQVLAIFDNNSNQTNWNNFYEENHYREYTLENVEFTMSSASNGDEAGGLDIVKFELDDNSKIVGVKLYALNSNEINDFEHQDESDDAYFDRTGDDSNMFSFVQEREEHEPDFEHGGVKNIKEKIIGTTTVETYGNETGNRYSDFGRFIVNAQEYKYDESGNLIQEVDEGGNPIPNPMPQVSYEPFAGGYADKKITDLPSDSIEFAGRAVGTIKGKDEKFEDLHVDGKAILSFNGITQNQALEMQFDNWYNVTIDKNINSDQLKFTFDGTVEDNNYALADMASKHKEVTIANPGNYNGKGYENSLTKGKLEVNYYGDNGNPEEFVGVTQYVESIQNEGEIRVNLGFGGTRQ